jgi:hypothetical protein
MFRLAADQSKEPTMRHAFVDIADKTMCSRCGNEVFRVDEACPAVSDGAIYTSKPNAADEYFDAISDVVEANPITLGVRRGKSET